MNDTLRYLYHRHKPAGDRWYPFLCVYYLTHACDFRCPYCSDGKGNPYHAQAPGHMGADRVDALFAKIRQACNSLELTGGEPLLHPEVDRVLEYLPRHAFKETVLTTNGWHLEEHLDPISKSISTLVVSLDTLVPDTAARWYGKGPGTLERILSAIRSAARLPRTGLVVSAVATPDNCADLPEVARFAWDLGATFACYPQLLGTIPPPDLRTSEPYRELYDFLIEAKARGRKVFATAQALRWMRDLPKFPCHPSTLVAVAPDGDVLYPCLEIGHKAGNLFEARDLHEIFRTGLQRHGRPSGCGNQCHSACSLGFSSILEHPSTMLEEVSSHVRGLFAGRSR